MQVSRSSDNNEKLVDERSRVGPAYVKLWHQGIRRLFDACCLMYDKTPEELCDDLVPCLVKRGLSPDDIGAMRLVLLRQEDLSLRLASAWQRDMRGKPP